MDRNLLHWLAKWQFTSSHPVGGAWIEICTIWRLHSKEQVAPRRGAWIEIGALHYAVEPLHVAPRRSAWIEI